MRRRRVPPPLLRRPGPPPIATIAAPTHERLVAWVERMSGSPPGLFVDLSMGAWRPHQAAAELCLQVGLEPPAAGERRRPRAAAGLSYADTIAAGIDAEARGRVGLERAVELAAVVAAALRREPPRPLVVIPPRPDAGWEEEDVAFLVALGGALRERSRPLVLAVGTAGAAEAPEGLPYAPPGDAGAAGGGTGGVAGLFPGLVPAELAARIDPAGSLPALSGGLRLVPPELRPRATRPWDFDRFAARVADEAALAAWAQLRGSNFHVDPELLSEHAWACLDAGAAGMALRLMERSALCRRDPLGAAGGLAGLQGMRIACHRHAEAAAASDPSPALPLPLRSFLLETKGWGLAMLGGGDEAVERLDRAAALLPAEAPRRERLYLLNIRALAELRSGHPDRALEIEREIADGLAALPEVDWHLTYVNRLNMARLLADRGDLEAAERSFAAAFETTLGARSDSDLVFQNVCRGRLEEARGNAAAALRAWLRAALHWLAGPVPEALAPRVTRTLAGAAAGPEEVAAALAQALCRTASALGWDADGAEGEPGWAPAIARPEAVGTVRRVGRWAVGGAGGGVLVQPSAPARGYDGVAHRRLRRLAASLLDRLLEEPELRRAPVLLVDSGDGCEMPRGAADLLASALRWRAVRWRGGRIDVELTPEVRCRLRQRMLVVRGPAVASVEPEAGGAVVRFRRTLPPHWVGGAVERVLRAVAEPVPAPSLTPWASERLLRRMERERLIRRFFAEDIDVERLVSARL